MTVSQGHVNYKFMRSLMYIPNIQFVLLTVYKDTIMFFFFFCFFFLFFFLFFFVCVCVCVCVFDCCFFFCFVLFFVNNIYKYNFMRKLMYIPNIYFVLLTVYKDKIFFSCKQFKKSQLQWS